MSHLPELPMDDEQIKAMLDLLELRDPTKIEALAEDLRRKGHRFVMPVVMFGAATAAAAAFPAAAAAGGAAALSKSDKTGRKLFDLVGKKASKKITQAVKSPLDPNLPKGERHAMIQHMVATRLGSSMMDAKHPQAAEETAKYMKGRLNQSMTALEYLRDANSEAPADNAAILREQLFQLAALQTGGVEKLRNVQAELFDLRADELALLGLMAREQVGEEIPWSQDHTNTWDFPMGEKESIGSAQSVGTRVDDLRADLDAARQRLRNLEGFIAMHISSAREEVVLAERRADLAHEEVNQTLDIFNQQLHQIAGYRQEGSIRQAFQAYLDLPSPENAEQVRLTLQAGALASVLHAFEQMVQGGLREKLIEAQASRQAYLEEVRFGHPVLQQAHECDQQIHYLEKQVELWDRLHTQMQKRGFAEKDLHPIAAMSAEERAAHGDPLVQTVDEMIRSYVLYGGEELDVRQGKKVSVLRPNPTTVLPATQRNAGTLSETVERLVEKGYLTTKSPDEYAGYNYSDPNAVKLTLEGNRFVNAIGAAQMLPGDLIAWALQSGAINREDLSTSPLLYDYLIHEQQHIYYDKGNYPHWYTPAARKLEQERRAKELLAQQAQPTASDQLGFTPIERGPANEILDPARMPAVETHSL